MSHQAIPDAAEHGCQTQHAASSMLHTTADGCNRSMARSTKPSRTQHDKSTTARTRNRRTHWLTRRPALLKTGLARSMQHATETGCYENWWRQQRLETNGSKLSRRTNTLTVVSTRLTAARISGSNMSPTQPRTRFWRVLLGSMEHRRETPSTHGHTPPPSENVRRWSCLTQH